MGTYLYTVKAKKKKVLINGVKEDVHLISYHHKIYWDFTGTPNATQRVIDNTNKRWENKTLKYVAFEDLFKGNIAYVYERNHPVWFDTDVLGKVVAVVGNPIVINGTVFK